MKQTAQGLAALGRGPDTELVHMAPSEVAGLQALAQAHGGSLTVNPHTGLPEAGFLSSIMPMVIGAGLMAAGVPAPMAGMLVGGGTAMATGNLSKGLMAGLGAYGGAGLTEGLMGAGANSLSAGAGAAAEVPIGAVVPQAVAPTVAQTAAQAATPEILGGYPAAPMPGAVGTVTAQPVITAPTAPAPTLSPTGDFARFDRAFSPGLNASPMDQMGAGLQSATASPSAAWDFAKANKYPLGAIGISALGSMEPTPLNAPTPNKGMIRPYTYSREKIPGAFVDVPGDPRSSKERRYFTDQYTALTPYKAPGAEYMAAGGPVEAMSNANAIGTNTSFPQADIRTGAYASPYQRPISENIVTGAQDTGVDSYTGQATFADGGPAVAKFGFGGAISGLLAAHPEMFSQAPSTGNVGGYTYDPATGQYTTDGALSDYESGNIGGYAYNPTTQQYTQSAVTPEGQARRAAAAAPSEHVNTSIDSSYAQGGGISDLGSYSDGGRLLRGPGDGVSDSIPAMIGQKQQARLADGEFVVPARIVSELGNGSTEAGARQLYAMMDRVQKNRKKSMGKDKVATDAKSHKLLPA